MWRLEKEVDWLATSPSFKRFGRSEADGGSSRL
jgi:hypothetical protein